MNDVTRSLALRAVARIALGATFSLGMVGCGESSDVQAPSAESGAESGAENAAIAESGADSAAGAEREAETPLGQDDASPLDSADADASLVDLADANVDASQRDPTDGPAEASDSPLACVGSVLLRRGADAMSTEVTPAQLACCLAYGESYLSDSSAPVDAAKQDAQLVDCCTAVIARVELHGEDYSAVHAPLRQLCCSGEVVAAKEALFSYRLCTPWGPPVPPAMVAAPGELA